MLKQNRVSTVINTEITDEDIIKLISTHKIISFDIYDTLLIRLFCNPTDLFKYISIKEKKEEFYEQRINAEITARKNSSIDKEDITIDDIYNYMPNNLKLFKDIELIYEQKYTVQHQVNFKIYNEALRQNKTIILVSDMYLPKEFLSNLLEKNGYTRYEKIFISGEIGKTKLKGSLYDYVLKDMKVQPSEIIHFGDSYHNDIKQAKKHKIDCYKLESYISDFLTDKNNRKFSVFYKLNKQNVYVSILIAVFALHSLKNKKFSSFDELLGYYIGGIVAYSYVKFIISVSENYETLLFVARDGYLLQKIYRKLAKEIKTNIYINAQRILNIQCFGYESDKYLTTKVYLSSNNIKYNKWDVYFRRNQYYQKYQKDILLWQEKNRKEYKKYLDNINIPGNTLLSIDMTTGNFTSKRFLQKMLPNKNVIGMFFSTASKKIENNCCIYMKRELLFKEKDMYLIAEPLFTSNEPAIQGIKNGKPVYNEYSDEISKKVYKKNIATENGINQFIDELTEFFGDIEFPKEIINEYLYKYVQHSCKQDIVGYKNTLLSDGNIQNRYNKNLYNKLKKYFK